jgi:ribosomal protein S18 acetylase RimI-like enzyme
MGTVTPHPAAAPAEPKFTTPERLTPTHDLRTFDSGSQELDEWLRRRALRNEPRGGSRTYVVRHRGQVAGFYCLANGAVIHTHTPGKIRQNMPYPIPVMVLGRLAVDRRFQGQGLGRALVRDAILRTAQAAEIAGIRAIVVHAKDEQARLWYDRFGFFLPSPTDPLTLLAPLQEVTAALQKP